MTSNPTCTGDYPSVGRDKLSPSLLWLPLADQGQNDEPLAESNTRGQTTQYQTAFRWQTPESKGLDGDPLVKLYMFLHSGPGLNAY